jgi:two-component system sensor histidine kinase ChvG
MDSGCWIVVTALEMSDVLAASIGQPFWQTPQVRVALLIYALMALITISLFVGLWRNLRSFGGVAHEIRVAGDTRKSFVERNRIPELRDVAIEFDALVGSLRKSVFTIRQAAEENAHALKTPLAVIAQSVEPLRHAVAAGNDRAARALERIERSVERLDALVSTVRRTDEAVADLINPPRERIDISMLVTELAGELAEIMKQRSGRLVKEIEPGLHILGGENLVESIVENLIENAITFSPPGGRVWLRVALAGRHVELAVLDEGPGVDPRNLESIFDRYVSIRPAAGNAPPGGGEFAGGHQAHFGIGLWVVRRNVEAMLGTVEARNRDEGGFSVIAKFPRG